MTDSHPEKCDFEARSATPNLQHPALALALMGSNRIVAGTS